MSHAKKILFTVLIILALVLLFACGGQTAGGRGTAETYGDASAPADATTKNFSETEATVAAAAKEEPTEAAATVPETETAGVAAGTETTETVSEDSTFSITFLDVGQGDAALIECDGHYMLVDGGDRFCSSLMYSALDGRGIGHLDLIVASHPDADHIGGLAGALNRVDADLVLCPVQEHDSETFSDFAKYAEKNGNGIKIPNAGDRYSLGSADILILSADSMAETSNNSSILLKITYGGTSFLFAGDLEREGEQAVLESPYAQELKSTVLKVAHHGSDSSTSYPFLREVMPEQAVISVGKGNRYGHPTENLLSRLRDEGAKVYRTDMQGDITCTSDGKTVSFMVEKNADADTLRANTIEENTAAQTAADMPVIAGESGSTYILNIRSKKFHYPDCSGVKKMADHNKQEFAGTRDEAIAMGYSPCQICNP